MKKEDLESFLAEPQRRSGTFEASTANAEKRTIELSFSSEIELERWPGMLEVLSHEAGAVELDRLNNGAPLLFNHDLDEVLGVVESASIGADRKGRAVVRFGNSERASEVFRDVQDGILRNVSVGYRIKEIKLDESREDVDRYMVRKWEPYEVSIVTVPADTSVGVGRSLKNSTHPKTMKLNSDAPEGGAQAPDIELVRSEAGKQAVASEQARVAAILDAGNQFGQRELAEKALREGASLEQFRVMLLDEVSKSNKRVVESSKIGMGDKEARSFSLVKLLRALAAENPEDRKKFAEQAAFELEACRAASDRYHGQVRDNGTVLPVEVMLSGTRAGEIISASAITGGITTGPNAVPTTLQSGSFIDVLRNKAKLLKHTTELAGLVGNIDIPKKIDASTATWVGEDTAGSRQAVNFGLVSLRPKTVTNYAEITRRMLMQTAIGVEGVVREDLMAQLGLEIDRVGFYGTGTGNQPTGLKNVSGIGSVSFATAAKPTFAELVQMETLVALANADVDGMVLFARPDFRGYAKTTRRLSTATDSNTIWEPGNTVNGYPVEITNQITSGDVFFGNFRDLIIGMWGGLQITVDPYTFSTQGRIRIVQFQDVDFAVRRAASFAYGA